MLDLTYKYNKAYNSFGCSLLEAHKPYYDHTIQNRQNSGECREWIRMKITKRISPSGDNMKIKKRISPTGDNVFFLLCKLGGKKKS